MSETPIETSAIDQPALDGRQRRVLVVDDHPNMVASLAMSLRQRGYTVNEARGGRAAVEQLVDDTFDVVLTDLRMEGVDGLAVLKHSLSVSPLTQVIVMTAFGTIEIAVEAMKSGAFEFIAKPFDDEQLGLKIANAAERRRLLTQVRLLSGQFQKRYGLDHIIGRSGPIRELMTRAVRVAKTDATVLVTGESGTGKELIARAIHANSKRSEHPFVPVNCAAIPDSLLESELFGHAKGAYTGAVKSRRGLFEEASGGTFFFDEIGETSLSFQAKLLRAIQEGEVRRVGENTASRVDVRIIAATNVDLRLAVAEKRFREDLFYRLNVVPVRVPPLRERRDDVPILARHFLEKFDERNATRHVFSDGALARLKSYDFPGNVRELENLVEQAAALASSEIIGATDVFLEPGLSGTRPAEDLSLATAVDEAERLAIRHAIDSASGDLQEAARLLQVSATTLWRKMKRHHIER